MKPGATDRPETPWNIPLIFTLVAAGICAGGILFHRDMSRIAAFIILLLAVAGICLAGLWRRQQDRHYRVLDQAAVDRLRAEEEIRNIHAELESFSYSVSHDLRAPLRAIDGFSQILLEDHAGSLDAEGRRLLDVVRENTEKMGRLIEDLLAFSRLNRSEMRPSLIDMTNLAQSVYYELTSPEERARIEFTIGQLPACQVDTTMLKQVWMNLLSNAIKFSSRREHPAIEVGGLREGSENIYFVRDNGVGFDMEYAGKLFGVFQRLHGPREFKGTGVGLASAQRILHRHGGRIWAEGAVDAGATFTFALPEKRCSHDSPTHGR